MNPLQTTAGLTAFEGRGPGTDAERRAARWLAAELQSADRDVRLEPFWCRPNWALAHAWHAALGLAGSLLAVSSPRVGGALVLIALLSVIADALTGRSLGRRLTFERASQNVVAMPRIPGHDGSRIPGHGDSRIPGHGDSRIPGHDDSRVSANAESPVHLILTANYDAGRTALVYRSALRRPAARLAAITGGPGWLGWFAIALTWLLIIAILRLGGVKGTAIGAAQLLPTVGLVLALALLVEAGTAGYGPGAGDNAAGTAVAVALAQALDAAPLRNASVELVLQGAGEGGGIGLRRHLRAHRRTLTQPRTVVLGIAPCGSGRLRWWVGDGAFVPLRYLDRLRALCARVAAAEPHFGARPHRGRGLTPGTPALLARRPAITIGTLDEHELAGRSHQSGDTADSVDPAALDATLAFALLLADEIDAFLGRRQADANAPRPA